LDVSLIEGQPALLAQRRAAQPAATAHVSAVVGWLAGISAGIGAMFFQSFGGTMSNHSVA
jgi:hypothetical protein